VLDELANHFLIFRLCLLLSDKRAFFLVSTSDVGAQIYELVANSKDEKNKFVQICVTI